MSRGSSAEFFLSVLVEMNGLYMRKNADYGNSFEQLYHKMGQVYPFIHLSEKMGRIEQLSLSDKEPEVVEESLRDSLIDLANYAVMWIAEMDREKEAQKPTFRDLISIPMDDIDNEI